MSSHLTSSKPVSARPPEPVKACLIGTGGMARSHLRKILRRPEATEVLVICEPSEEAGLAPPPNQPDLDRLLADHGNELDAALIVTPHVLHFEQAKACLEAGVDVLLEKPMVMNAAEAVALIEARDRAGRLLVVSFNGSLSPKIRKGVELLRSGSLGEILNVSATVWQSWKGGTTGSWRQVPEIAGGGFLFDTGAHMLNTITDLLGEDFADVSAWFDNRGTDVDILGTVMARTVSGVLVTMNGCGEAIKSCHSDVRIFCTKAIVRADVWGGFLEVQREGEDSLTPVDTPPLARPVGSVPQGPKRRAGEPLPAGGGPEDGPALGRHPRVCCPRGHSRKGRTERCARRLSAGAHGRRASVDLRSALKDLLGR